MSTTTDYSGWHVTTNVVITRPGVIINEVPTKGRVRMMNDDILKVHLSDYVPGTEDFNGHLIFTPDDFGTYTVDGVSTTVSDMNALFAYFFTLVSHN